MKLTSIRNGLCVAAALAAVVTIAVLQNRQPRATAAPRGDNQFELVSAQRFHVDKPYHHVWRADQPLVHDGWLLVLACDGALLRPRQVAERVLYVGDQTAQRVNVGEQSGRVVVLVPGDFALTSAPIFLGKEALPEELRQPQIDAELAATKATPPTAAEVAKVLVEAPLRVADDYELRLRAIDLVEQFSPYETDLIRGARAPLVR